MNLQVMQALQRLRNSTRHQEMLEALKTMTVILGNVLNHPYEKKFSQVRLANRGFHSRCGRHPAALEILKLAGFRSERDATSNEDVLRLSRSDPGLLWLIRSCVEGATHSNIQDFTESVASKVSVPS